jgi:conjugative transfer signal peptidase TraF
MRSDLSWLMLGLAPAPFALASILVARPVLLLNTSASEPVGVYVATDAKPAPGARIAFRIPEPGRAYAARSLPERLRSSELKTVLAGEGDKACTLGGRLVINGQDLAPIVARDSRGGALPHWRDCRALKSEEYFVFSGRIPNSFDSRYYGPVPARDVIGVYRPLSASETVPRGERGA